MGYPTVPYTFTNGTAADATQANSNFTAILNGMSDGTKDILVAALTCAGSASFNGAVTLGNASGDDITVNGSIASHLVPEATDSYDLGSATYAFRHIYSSGAFATTLTTDATSTAAGSIKTAGGIGAAKGIYAARFCSSAISDLADDTAISFTPPVTTGILMIGYVGALYLQTSTLFFRVGASAAWSEGGLIDEYTVVGTGALTTGAGDGTDARFNINVHTDGKIYIKNRTGSEVTGIFYVIFGA